MRLTGFVVAAGLIAAPALAQQNQSPPSTGQIIQSPGDTTGQKIQSPGQPGSQNVQPPGQASGQNMQPREQTAGQKIQPPGQPPDPAANAFSTRISAKHGPYLIDGDGRTVYLFGADTPPQGSGTAKINCTKACEQIFPPVVLDGSPQAKESVKADMFGVVERPDGRLQTTYGGWPLYYYIGDRGKGQAQAALFDKPQFGGEWHLVGPDGKPANEKVFPDDRFSELDLKSPECVRHDPERGFYLVSNVHGKLAEADNNGFITRIGKDGLKLLKWIEGGKEGVTLHAPTGMQIANGRLYVTDIDHLRVFDIGTGKPLGAVKIAGAQLLNDLAVDEDAVYVTDSGAHGKPGAVYRVVGDGTVTKIVPGRVIERPDGIDLDDQGRLHVTEFAGDQVFIISTEGEILGETKLDAGQLDGIVVRPDGDVLVSSWNGDNIVRIKPDGKTETILTGLTTPACFDVEDDQGKTLLLVPEFDENKVTVALVPTQGEAPQPAAGQN